jgi:hypothetical protein
MPSRRLAEFVERGVLYNACSLYQLEQFGQGRAWRQRLCPYQPRTR